MAYQGRCTSAGYGKETVWGTPVARTIWLPPLLGSATLARQVSKQQRNVHRCSGTVPVRRSHYIENDNVGGGVGHEVTYDNFGMVLEHVLGANATTGPTASKYTHTITLDEDVAAGLTIELIRGTSAVSEVFEGCYANTVTLTSEAGGLMTLSLDDIIGETSATRGAAGTATEPTSQILVKHFHAGQFNWNSVNYDIRSFSLSINNNYARRQQLGSKLTSKPERSGPIEITCDVTLEAAEALYSGYKDDTESDFTLTFTDPDSSTRTIGFTGHNSFIQDYGDPISDDGVVLSNMTFRVQGDGTDHGLKIVYENENSAVTDFG